MPDRVLGLAFGAAAVPALQQGLDRVMVALHSPHIRYMPLAGAIATMKVVPSDGELVLTARALGISLAD